MAGCHQKTKFKIQENQPGVLAPLHFSEPSNITNRKDEGVEIFDVIPYPLEIRADLL